MESWLKELGAEGLDDLELAEFPVTGRGLKMKKNATFKKGDRILTIPKEAQWTVKRAFADPLIGTILRSVQPALSVENILVIFLLFVRSRRKGYEGERLHLAAVPETYSSTIFFTEEELEVCKGSSLYNVTKQLEYQIDDDYRALVMGVLGPHPDLFPLEHFTIADYKWALCTVWSRGMDFQLPDQESIRLIAPFADMANHSPDVEQCHAYDTHRGGLSIYAGKNYKAGDQLYISYGPVPNNRLLRLYGFVVPKNPHDSYDLVLTTSPMAPFYEQKLKLFNLVDLSPEATISLTRKDPLPNQVLQYLRIQRLGASDFATLARQDKDVAKTSVGIEIEREILEFLVDSLSAILAGFEIPLETLKERTADGTYGEGGNSWAAAHVSIGEQEVLQAAKEKAEGLSAKAEEAGTLGSQSLPTECANCKKALTQSMLCAGCKAVQYCGRDCQRSHWKQHKEICKIIASVKA